MLKVKIIQNRDALKNTDPHEISHLLWGTASMPRTFFYIGFVPDDGFYIHMICEEKDPRRIYSRYLDPVYRDSAMEAFFLFQGRNAQNTYLNFEMNANGALLAEYGPSRTDRSCFSDEEARQFQAEASLEKDRWSISLRIPLSVLNTVYGSVRLDAGSSFFCNFYKISEAEDIEHYGAYHPIDSPVPSFHMPEYFAEAVLEMQ